MLTVDQKQRVIDCYVQGGRGCDWVARKLGLKYNAVYETIRASGLMRPSTAERSVKKKEIVK